MNRAQLEEVWERIRKSSGVCTLIRPAQANKIMAHIEAQEQMMEQMVVALSTLLDHKEIDNEDCRVMTEAAVEAYRQWKEERDASDVTSV